MKSLCENFHNGNLSDARRQAKRFSARAIREGMEEHLGYTFKKATLSADYLKTGEGWQECCDAD